MRIKQNNPNTAEYWDKIYSNEITQNIRREDFYRFSIMEKAIPDNVSILEVGCGKGEFYEFLKKKKSFDYRKAKYIGIDISKVAIDYSQRLFSKANFLHCDKKSLSFFNDNSYDVIVAMEILEHIDNLELFANEVKRVLKVGGKFIAITPHKNKVTSTEHIWSFTLDDINELFMSSRNKVVEPYIIVEWVKQELVIDFDDFSEKNNKLKLLKKLKKEIPNLKVTLFTIPSDCSKEFCQKIAKLDWVELALHGEKHNHLECSTWTKEKALEVLNHYEKWGCFKKVFKPPFWAGSEGLYEALSEKNYIVAQNKNIVGDNQVYRIDNNSNAIHCHIQDVCGNGLKESFNYLKSLKGHSFKFISELYE